MNRMTFKEYAVLLLLLSLMISGSGARADAVTHSSDPRLVCFTYDAETTYTILAIPGVPTDIQLAPGEKITGFALGDTIQWVVEELPGHLFIKPIKPELFTAGTLVTDRRVYQLVFRSTTLQGHWMQKVSWREASTPQTTAPVGAVGAESGKGPDVLPPATRHCDYDIEGEADFRPLSVCDDGRFTWIQMSSPQALPALFRVDDKEAVLVNYIIQGNYFMVQRLMPEILLKLGNAEVRITRRKS